MARTSSLNCLSCRNPYQTPHSLNPSPLFTENPFFFTEKCFVGSPAQKSTLILDCNTGGLPNLATNRLPCSNHLRAEVVDGVVTELLQGSKTFVLLPGSRKNGSEKKASGGHPEGRSKKNFPTLSTLLTRS